MTQVYRFKPPFLPSSLTSSSGAGVWHEASLLSWGVFNCSSSSHSCRFWFSCSCTLRYRDTKYCFVFIKKNVGEICKMTKEYSKWIKHMHRYPARQYSRHTVPNPQAHAVSHSVAQGDQRQFSDWPSNGSLTSQFLRSSPWPIL